MTLSDPKAAERMRDALELIASNLEDQLGRARARVGSLVASAAADAQALAERHKQDGADAVDAAILAVHVRELRSVVDFAERAAAGRKSRP